MQVDSFNDNIGISYFDPFSLFDNVKDEFLQLFPINNVQWKLQNSVIKTRLIQSLPIDIYSEDEYNRLNSDNSIKSTQNRPFLKLIIVTCQSVDEYRAKIRPLLREWTSNEQEQVDSITKLPFIPLILFYGNSKVTESNLFSSTNIIEKIKKDFPTSEVLELKSVYKSPNDKQTFWTHLQNNIKRYLLTIFERRFTFLNETLLKLTANNNNTTTTNNNQQLYNILIVQEQLLNLYMQFKLKDECQRQIHTIKRALRFYEDDSTDYGKLEYPFSFNLSSSISDLLKTGKLTKFDCYKYFFIWDLKCYSINNDVSSIEKICYIIKKFLRHVQILFPDDINLIQFKYSLIAVLLKKFFSLPPSSTVDKHFIECKADLLFIKRDCWMKGILSTTDFKLLYKQYSNTKNIKFDVIDQELLINENKFHEAFINFNQELIGLYNQCDSKRQRIVDILSLEIGMIYYQRGDYENAILLFLSCYEYYIQSKWNVIGLQILKIFVDSIEKCGDNNIKSLEFNGSNVSLAIILNHSYLNLLKLCDDPEERAIWWDKFIKLDSNQDENDDSSENVHSMDEIINFGVDKYVTMDQPNSYSIKLYFKEYKIPDDVRIDSIELSLQRKTSDTTKEMVIFQNNNIKFNGKNDIICLNTKEINFGKFEKSQLKIKIGNNCFIQRYNKKDNQTIHIEPIFNKDSIRFKIEQERCLNLGDNKLCIKFFNIDKINKFRLNLLVEKDDKSIMYPISFNESDNNDIQYIIDSKDNLSRIKDNDRDICHGITVPYYFQDSVMAFFIKTIFEFEIINPNNGQIEIYKEINHHFIQCYLPISVSVEDIFKNKSFYFKFLLNSSIREEPIMLYSSELNGISGMEKANDTLTDRYAISGHLILKDPILLASVNNESCINSYKLTIKNHRKFIPNDLFYLHVKYNTLREELDNILTNQLLSRDKDGDINRWKIFWEINILPRLQYNYERYYKEGILTLEADTIDLGFIEEDLLRRVPMEDGTRLTILKCLKTLNNPGYKMIEYNNNKEKDIIFQRELIVPVELQSPVSFYLVQFEMIEPTESNIKKETYSVGECIPFRITITDISDQWEKEGDQEEEGEEDIIYIFEIASSNDWLLHGKKRFAINKTQQNLAKKNDPYIVNISLIPLKRGYLNLPRIEMMNRDETQMIKMDQPNEHDTVLVL